MAQVFNSRQQRAGKRTPYEIDFDIPDGATVLIQLYFDKSGRSRTLTYLTVTHDVAAIESACSRVLKIS